MPTLILMRHGESVWNKKNLFTGWVDVPLSPKGIEEALDAGQLLEQIPIDAVYTSTLIRAQMTAMLALKNTKSGKTPYFVKDEEGEKKEWSKNYNKGMEDSLIPVYTSWMLNERMYGELQGLDKEETRKKYGKEQVHIWRRSFDTPPPGGESLKMTSERTLPYFFDVVVKTLDEGKNTLISAHGNSLRSILMKLDSLSEEEVLSLEIPTGVPILYSYSEGEFQKIDLSANV